MRYVCDFSFWITMQRYNISFSQLTDAHCCSLILTDFDSFGVFPLRPNENTRCLQRKNKSVRSVRSVRSVCAPKTPLCLGIGGVLISHDVSAPAILLHYMREWLVLVIDLTLCPFLILPSELLVANTVLSILSHLHPSHVPNPWYRYRHLLGFQRSW